MPEAEAGNDMNDNRRSANIRTGLLLAAVAACFFLLVVLRRGVFGG